MSGPADSALDARGLPRGYSFKPEHEITPRDASAGGRGGSLLIVDVRTAEEVAVARVEGAAHIPLHELESRFSEIEDALDAAPGRGLAFLCHHGVRSMKAALFARHRGIESAMSIAGGIDLWSLAADPGVPRYERDAGGCRRI